jgi:glyoxylase-like metal-dependent hydrolase (beta-lactamase superfamily II)
MLAGPAPGPAGTAAARPVAPRWEALGIRGYRSRRETSMRISTCLAPAAAWTLLLAAPALCADAPGATPDIVELAPGVHLIAGSFVPGVQPDGNTVVFTGPDGLVVLDTGRHPEHTQEILDFARAAKLPIVAVVNSHWHLDHIGGNGRVRRAYPEVRIYASDAYAAARTGFLASYRKQLEQLLAQTKKPEDAATFRAELAILDEGDALAPDVVISETGRRKLAGRELELHLERHAVTAGDVWVLDPSTRVLAAGDLVTLPAPLLDTACPEGWRRALGDLAAADFSKLVPGHGEPMDRPAFETWRKAFDALLDCGASARPAQECVDGWLHDAASLIPEADQKLARGLVEYYVGASLRADSAHTAALCGG